MVLGRIWVKFESTADHGKEEENEACSGRLVSSKSGGDRPLFALEVVISSSS